MALSTVGKFMSDIKNSLREIRRYLDREFYEDRTSESKNTAHVPSQTSSDLSSIGHSSELIESEKRTNK